MRKLKYEKPIFQKVGKMVFPTEIMQHGRKIVCRQCSSCHGCR